MWLGCYPTSCVATEAADKWFAILSHKEDTMLEVTPAATEQIAAYFQGKEVKPIRIFLNQGG